MVTAALPSSRPDLPPVDLRRVARGIYGTTRLAADGRSLWWAAHTPDGPATLLAEQQHAKLDFTVWGPGGDWMCEQAPRVVGWHDAPHGFRPAAGVVRDLWRRSGGLRLGRTDRVFDAALEAVLGQKVQTTLARRSLRRIVAALGEPAPGPARLTLFPTPQRLAALSYVDLHPFGVERRRADTLLRVARHASRLEAAGRAGPERLEQCMRAIPGVGIWTSALVLVSALGDPDAVPVGDFHLPHVVCWALAGEPRGDDQRMLDLLEPFRPHRGRVVAMLVSPWGYGPRFGPRLECLPVDGFDRPDAGLRDRGPHGGGHRGSPRRPPRR